MAEQPVTHNHGNIETIEAVHEMRTSFLQYSMSVITSRAIPDVRDGLKPVQRRIVFAMNDMGCVAGTAFKKSARIEGECLGKYHPHGGVYGAMVNMAQTFGMEEVLVDGQGNFGSIDGDPPAAMRYTEARLSKLAMEMIADIDMDTIDWRPNYDGSLQEPVVLPSRFPNLLVNGSQGIAVGMATSIPSHNLTECMNALMALADNAELTNADIIRDYIPAPDFPTGGLVYGRDDIDRAYHTGRGRCLIRSKYHIEKTKGDKREQIVFTEIPYQVNKASEISKIADLVRDKKIEGISDIRDESDKDGIRIVVVLKKDESPDLIVNQILQSTELQKSFPITFLAIVNGQPRVMNLKEMLLEFLYFRQEVVTRRTTFLLNKATDRLHVLKALELALSKLDATIKTIRAAGNPAEAKIALQDLLSIDEKQASAILALTLQRLTGLERQKIVDEIAALGVEVATYQDILANYTSLMNVIKAEFQEIITKFGKPRNSELSVEMAKISKEDVIADEEVIISFSRDGYIKRTPADTYKRQKRGGKGKVGMGTKSEDVVDQLFSASNHENLLIFTNKGNVYTVKVYDIPEAGATGKGRAIANLIDLKKDEEIETFFTAKTFPKDEYLLFFTRNGIVKKTSMDNYATVRSNGLIAVNLEDGDSLIAVKRTNGNKQVVIATGLGKAIRFNETDIRSVGRSAIGVGGIKLLSNDFVVDAEVIDPVTEIAEGEEADTNVDKQQGVFLTITENGYGVRTSIQEYRLQGRNGGGIINTRTGPKNGLVCGFNLINEDEEVIVMTESGMTIRFDPQEVRKAQRGSMGVQVTKLKAGDRIVGIVKVSKEEPEIEEETTVTETAQ